MFLLQKATAPSWIEDNQGKLWLWTQPWTFSLKTAHTQPAVQLLITHPSLWDDGRLRCRNDSKSCGLFFHILGLVFRKYLYSCGHLQEQAATKVHQLLCFQHGCIRPLQPFDRHDYEDRWDYFRLGILESRQSVAAGKHSMQPYLISPRCFSCGFYRNWKPSFDLNRQAHRCRLSTEGQTYLLKSTIDQHSKHVVRRHRCPRTLFL